MRTEGEIRDHLRELARDGELDSLQADALRKQLHDVDLDVQANNCGGVDVRNGGSGRNGVPAERVA